VDNAAAFIDGFNLYHGMNSCGLRAYLWVDLWEMCRLALPGSVHLNELHYFTAPSKTPGSNSRQGDFISAQEELHPSIHVVRGQFRADYEHCAGCDHTKHQRWVEKRSDVNMALEALTGALLGAAPRYGRALLVTADSDQVPTVEALQQAGVHVTVAFPPGRFSDHLKDTADRWLKLGKKHIIGAQMQTAVTLTAHNNHVIHRPNEWGEIPSNWPELSSFEGFA
jgi:uncharacterized LabA/DUF88 family protein